MIKTFKFFIELYYLKSPTEIPKACFLYYMAYNNSALLYREAKAVKEKGFEVDVIDISSDPKKEMFQVFHGLNLFHIQSRLKSEKNTLLYFSRIIFFFIKATILFIFLTAKRRYKFIHVTTPPDFMVFATIIPKLFGTKILMDIHDIGPELYMRKLNVSENRLIIRILKIIEKISCRFSDHIITVTEIWREKLISRSTQADKCTVLLNVPDNNLFNTKKHPYLPDEKKFILFYHGSLEEHFGVDTLVKAMSKIKSKIPNVLLRIYGGGRIKNDLISLAKSLGVYDIIDFNDKVPFYEVPNILKNASLGIVPTKHDVFSDEALSMKSLEYISMNIPIVISKTKAHNYYYDESMVKFFEPEDVDDLAKSVIYLYQNQEIRKLQNRNTQKFLSKNGWHKSKKIYYDIINNILSNNKNIE